MWLNIDRDSIILTPILIYVLLYVDYFGAADTIWFIFFISTFENLPVTVCIVCYYKLLIEGESWISCKFLLALIASSIA